MIKIYKSSVTPAACYVAHTCLSNGIYQNNVFKTLLLDFMTYYQPITVSTETITDFQENKQNKHKKGLGPDMSIFYILDIM